MSLLQPDQKPDAVVTVDGSEGVKTITEAIALVPQKNVNPFVILVKPGVYNEYVEVPKHIDHVYLIGSGVDNTKITGNKCFANGVGTFQTPTLIVNGDHFTGNNITIENTAGPEGHQACAIRVSGDKAVFYNCQFDGYQDTLYCHTKRQFYRDCTISGTIDFIFGDAAAVFQHCKMVVRKPMPNQACMVTAQGRKDPNGTGGIILQSCVITGEPALMESNPPVNCYLGRPWKEYSRTIILNSEIDRHIHPEGWAPWGGDFALDTCYYGEFDNGGPSCDLTNRVKWKGIKTITPEEVVTYTPGPFLGLQEDDWVKITGVPYELGLMKA